MRYIKVSNNLYRKSEASIKKIFMQSIKSLTLTENKSHFLQI